MAGPVARSTWRLSRYKLPTADLEAGARCACREGSRSTFSSLSMPSWYEARLKFDRIHAASTSSWPIWRSSCGSKSSRLETAVRGPAATEAHPGTLWLQRQWAGRPADEESTARTPPWSACGRRPQEADAMEINWTTSKLNEIELK